MRQIEATREDLCAEVHETFAPLLGPMDAAPPRRIVRYRSDTRDLASSQPLPDNMPMVFQPLGRHGMDLDVEAVLIPGLAIWNVQSTSGFESVPDNMPDTYAIRIPLSCGLVSRMLTCDYETPAGSGSILPILDCVATRFAPGARVLSCAVGVRDLAARYEVLEGPDAPLFRFEPQVKIEGLRLHGLVRTIRQIGDHLETAADALTGPLLVDLLMNQILAAWPRHSTRQMERSSRAVHHAVDYIEAHLAEPLTMGDVAAAAGVSLRTLQSVFRAHTGRTPLGYILDRRLEQAHADLLANEGRLQVSQIAHRWGFLHMGEFARRYRLRYGCSPSQTNRRAP